MESSIIHQCLNLKPTNIEEMSKSICKKDSLKRTAEHSPDVGNKKRPVFGDITNHAQSKANLKLSTLKNSGKDIKVQKSSINVPKSKKIVSNEPESIIKQEPEDSELYITAPDGIDLEQSDAEENFADVENAEKSQRFDDEATLSLVPPGVEDFDKSNINDLYSESFYAPFIFVYYKEREKLFHVEKYLNQQPEINKAMRAILVDWMVEVQESFELNHETLYLAVKLVDRYLMKNVVPKAELQLVGATATFVAAKYDERIPPLVDDFLYICDDSYTRKQLIQTEVQMLQTIDYDLGIPLSYRFLRRYARCFRVSMELLTLARYILEMSLMDYDLIEELDSKIAAAALLLALKMKKQDWTPTLQYYSGYNEIELNELLISLNKNISMPPSKQLETIRKKYSHAIFHKVATIPPLNLKIKSSKSS